VVVRGTASANLGSAGSAGTVACSSACAIGSAELGQRHADLWSGSAYIPARAGRAPSAHPAGRRRRHRHRRIRQPSACAPMGGLAQIALAASAAMLDMRVRRGIGGRCTDWQIMAPSR
jgi:hypothetical protein